jgi:chemotaxis protein MotA
MGTYKIKKQLWRNIDMTNTLSVFKLLFKSIGSSDIIILIFAIATFLLWMAIRSISKDVKTHTGEWKQKKNPKFSGYLLAKLSKLYNLYLTLITIFPLLGMLGTVFGLLGLDMTGSDMENVRGNFFTALTSTAWGIIFATIFKLLNAVIEDDVEEKIETAKKLTD